MNRLSKFTLFFSAYVNIAVAQVATPQPSPTPDVMFHGGELDQIYRLLSTPDLYQRQPNGSMLPVMSQGDGEVMKIIVERIKDRTKEIAKEKTDKEAADKVKADAESASKATSANKAPDASSAPDATKTP